MNAKNKIELTKESVSHFIEMDELIQKRSKDLIPKKDPRDSPYTPRVHRTEIDTVAGMVRIHWYITGSHNYYNNGCVRITLEHFLKS